MDDEIELTPQQQFDASCPLIYSMDELNASVFDDEENLVVVFALAPTLCTYSAKIETTTIREATAPRAATAHARFFRIHLEKVDVSVIERLGTVSQTPTTFFFLKGQQVAVFQGSNVDKLVGHIRNEVVKRNEEMREYDEAKEEARRLEMEEREEAEENEDGDEEDDEEY